MASDAHDQPPRLPAEHDLTCREVSDFLGAYLADDLAPDERVRFDGHLAACPDCRAYLAQYDATRTLSRRALDADARGAGIPEALVRAILAARRGRPGP